MTTTGPAPSDPARDTDSDRPPAARSRRRLALTSAGWWLHGGVRVVLALALLFYGFSKVYLAQFGTLDDGDSLVRLGEMSPMGLLWRMVAFSPLFQVLSGLAEVGAAVALLWRRTVPLGALLAAASMTFVLVLNLGYDVPVKQLSLILLVMSLLVLVPWMPRLAVALLGRGAVPGSPLPVLVPWRPLGRVTDVLGPLAGIALVAAVGVGSLQLYPERSENLTAPAGVWQVVEDSALPAEQLAEDDRWQQVAFGSTAYDGRFLAQVRLADGTLLSGFFRRADADTVTLELRPLREPGQDLEEAKAGEPRRWTLDVEVTAEGHLYLTGDGVDLVLAPDTGGSVLHDRGFSWSPRDDDPFNR